MPPRKRTKNDKSGADKSSAVEDVSENTNGQNKRKVAPKNEDSAKKNEKASGTFSHWLMKSEPESRFENGIDMKFSFDDLKSSPDQTACWDGVRNYQARNFMRDGMKVGHNVFFYHSNCKEPGIVGICQVVKESYPDHTQFDPKDPHYDSASKKDNPRWLMVDVKYVRPLKRYITLAELKKLHLEHVGTGGPLRNMALFTRARLSVQPINDEEWDFILSLEEKPSEKKK